MLLKARATKVRDRFEDPRETLDYSHQRQLELLTQVQGAVADVTASRRRLELQMSALRREQAKLEDQIGQASGTSAERQALRRKAAIEKELLGVAARHHSMRSDEEKLQAACERLAAKVMAFQNG